MKKIILSAAVAAMAFSTSAVAADNGIDIKVGGQAAIYYETHDANGDTKTSMFNKEDSAANVGIQLDLGADLGNNFTFGSQLTYLGTAGLEKNMVAAVKQTAGTTVQGSTTDDFALTQIYLAKQIGNTTVKLGRQELPMSLSPLAFSEGWNVYKNTFDAIVAINTDIPKTTLVGAYVSGGTGMGLGSTDNLSASANIPAGALAGNYTSEVDGTAYMITASTTAIPMATVTASYYRLAKVLNDIAAGSTTAGLVTTTNSVHTEGIGADAFWLDVKIADKSLPMGMNIGLQAGQIKPDSKAKDAELTSSVATTTAGTNTVTTVNTVTALGDLELDDTTVYGAKISLKPIDALTVCLAYTDVDGDDDKINVAVKNTGTGIKTPLFTQMIYNQDAIALDAKTIMGKISYNMGDMGSISAVYGSTNAGESNMMGADADYKELDLIYKVKAGGVQYFAAFINRKIDEGGSMNGTAGAADDVTKDNRVRVWARYNF
jgi:hypothetical protein